MECQDFLILQKMTFINLYKPIDTWLEIKTSSKINLIMHNVSIWSDTL